jgi:GH35 family endo-1,4-beta-xylanase
VRKAATVVAVMVLVCGCASYSPGGAGGDDGDLRDLLQPVAAGTRASSGAAPHATAAAVEPTEVTPGSPADVPTLPPTQAPAVPTPPVAGAPVEYGMQIHGCGYAVEPALDLVVGAGFTWVKQQVRWEEVEGEVFGSTDWRCIDEVVEAAEARGLHILLSVTTSPEWSRPGTEMGAPDVLPLFGQFCLRLAERYRGRIDAVEVFNEPNLDREWGEHLDPYAYVTLLEWAYAGIKQEDPDVMVISAALAPTEWNDWATAVDDRLYLGAMAEARAGRYADCIGTHFNHTVSSPLEPGGEFERQMQDYYDAFAGEVPLCITEFGVATPDRTGARLPRGFEWARETSAAEQAQWLQDGLDWAREHPDVVRLVIVWNLNYHSDDEDDPNVPYSLWGPRGLMPAYYALQGMDE